MSAVSPAYQTLRRSALLAPVPNDSAVGEIGRGQIAPGHSRAERPAERPNQDRHDRQVHCERRDQQRNAGHRPAPDAELVDSRGLGATGDQPRVRLAAQQPVGEHDDKNERQKNQSLRAGQRKVDRIVARRRVDAVGQDAETRHPGDGRCHAEIGENFGEDRDGAERDRRSEERPVDRQPDPERPRAGEPSRILHVAAEAGERAADDEGGKREEAQRMDEDQPRQPEEGVPDCRRQHSDLRQISPRRHQEHPGKGF